MQKLWPVEISVGKLSPTRTRVTETSFSLTKHANRQENLSENWIAAETRKRLGNNPKLLELGKESYAKKETTSNYNLQTDVI